MDLRTLEVLQAVAREAAATVREVYDAPFRVEYKAPRDPVTDADRRANALICARLAEAFPGVPVVAEESDPVTWEGFRAAERVLFVDPLDGTQEFVDRIGEFVVMIGLLDGERAAAGVIHAPAQGRAWVGAPGLGAWEVDPDGGRRALSVGHVADLGQARVVASRSHRGRDLQRALDVLGVRQVLAVGSAGLKAVAVARGDAELYLATGYAGKRWDACAPDAVLTAAGGRFTDVRGRPIDYRGDGIANTRGVVASNGRLHDAVLERLATLGGAG